MQTNAQGAEPQRLTVTELLSASIARMEKGLTLATEGAKIANAPAADALTEIETWTAQALTLAKRLRGQVGAS